MARKKKSLFRFALFADDDASEVHTYGFVIAETQDEAFHRGDTMFTEGDSLEEARRLFGIDYERDDDDEGGPFFSVNEVESIDDFASNLAGKLIIGMTDEEDENLGLLMARALAERLAMHSVNIG